MSDKNQDDTGYAEHFENIASGDGEGETWGEAAERLRPDATIDLSCPNGCFELEVTASHEMGDALEFLRATAIQDDPGPCPNCHAEIEPEVLTDGGR